MKGHCPGDYEVTNHLISMLNALSMTDKRVFPTIYCVMYQCLVKLRKKTGNSLSNPALLDIDFKSFRHFGGSMLAHYSNGNVLLVQKMLRHRSVLNTMKYIHAVNRLEDDDFEEIIATSIEDIRKLEKAWDKI